MRVIVGAGGTRQRGWLSLQASDLDIRERAQWARLFAPGTLQAVLAEHVLEHLTPTEAQRTARNVYEFLRIGGHWRVAVPDGFYPSAAYLDWVAPGSAGEQWLNNFRGPDEPPHQVLWNYLSLSKMLRGIGFRVFLREWFDEHGQFHKCAWSSEHGDIWRSSDSLYSNALGVLVGAPYKSLIVDAVKG